jgi:hypothetical protein
LALARRSRKDDGLGERAPGVRREEHMTVKITVLANAPLKVTGDFEITDANGNKIEPKKPGEAFLCRCGHSANKPFCDGAHAKNGFKAP